MPRDSFTPYNGQSLVLPSEGNVICCGFLTHCMLVLIEDFPAQNGGAPINQIVDTLGDDAAIIAITLARWDVPVTLLSNPLGDDDYGSRVSKQLKTSGLEASLSVVQGISTPIEVGVVDSTGSRTYFQQRDSEAVESIPAPGDSQLSDARMLYVDWYDGAKILETMERAQAYEVPVFLNLESRYSDAPNLADLLRFTTVCQVSIDEPDASGDPFTIGQDLLDVGIGTALVTMGARGCAVVQGSQRFQIRPPDVRVIDGYGAGASFSAGMIYGFQAGWPLEHCARFATTLAGISCGIAGQALVTFDAVEKIAEGLTTERAAKRPSWGMPGTDTS